MNVTTGHENYSTAITKSYDQRLVSQFMGYNSKQGKCNQVVKGVHMTCSSYIHTMYVYTHLYMYLILGLQGCLVLEEKSHHLCISIRTRHHKSCTFALWGEGRERGEGGREEGLATHAAGLFTHAHQTTEHVLHQQSDCVTVSERHVRQTSGQTGICGQVHPVPHHTHMSPLIPSYNHTCTHTLHTL